MPVSTISTNRAVTYPGAVLQVVQAYKSDTFSTTSMSFVDVTGLSASITPISSSNKILVISTCAMGSANDFAYMRLVRGSTPIFIGDADGSRPQISAMMVYSGAETIYIVNPLTVNYLDSPATTSSTTYKTQIRAGSSPSLTYINRTASDRNTADYEPRVASSLILMEIAA